LVIGDKGKPKIEWVVDMTLAYPKAEPIDMPGICIGWWEPRDMHVHYRAYPISDIPSDSDGQLSWLYDRYEEKEKLLEQYYLTNKFPDTEDTQKRLLPRMPQKIVPFDKVAFLIAYAFYAVSAYIFWLYVYSPVWSLFSLALSLII